MFFQGDLLSPITTGGAIEVLLNPSDGLYKELNFENIARYDKRSKFISVMASKAIEVTTV